MGIAGLYIWSKWLKQKYTDWRIEREEREYDARYHKSKPSLISEFLNIANDIIVPDPDIGVGRSRQEAMEAARRKQQEKLNQDTALYAEIEKEVRPSSLTVC